MSNILKLVSPIPPSVNHYLATRAYLNKGKPICTVYETKEAKEYKKQFTQYIIEQVEKQEYDLKPDKAQHYYCDCVFYFNRIDMDCNNYFKLLLDAITETGLVWLDDNVVCERVNKILYDVKNPRIEMEIYPVDYIGIFDNKDSLNKFLIFECEYCKRNNINCSIRNKALAGKIQDDIKLLYHDPDSNNFGHDYVCKKKKN